MTPPDLGLVERFAAFFGRIFERRDGDARIALAVSGGADSMAMLALAAAAFPGRVIAATVDHGLRVSAADDCALVAGVCDALLVPHATLASAQPIEGASLQAQARQVRYRLLADWVRTEGITLLATAHQADDQAETFLMRAARGAGLSGLAGVRAARLLDEAAPPILLVRPLLDWRRAELRAIVRRAGLPFVDDPANDDARHDRTRFRRLLGDNEWLDPPRLARAAAHLAEADADLRAVADGVWAMRGMARGAIKLDVAAAPRGIRRRLAARAIGAVREASGIAAPDWSAEANIEPLLDALDRGKAATQAGVIVRPTGGVWQFKLATPRRMR